MGTDFEYGNMSNKVLAELQEPIESEYQRAKSEFLGHQREFHAIQSRRDRLNREIRRRKELKPLPTKLGWYRSNDGDFWRLSSEGWNDAWGNGDYPRPSDLPVTWIGNEE